MKDLKNDPKRKQKYIFLVNPFQGNCDEGQINAKCNHMILKPHYIIIPQPYKSPEGFATIVAADRMYFKVRLVCVIMF